MNADLIVVGGGIIGLCSALLFQLKSPKARVVVLEQSLVGSGTSHFGGASDVDYAWSDFHRALIKRGKSVRTDFSGAFEISQAVRTIWIGSGADPSCLYPRVQDPNFRLLNEDEARALPVTLSDHEFAFEAEQGRVGSPARACAQLAQRLRALGGFIFESTKVTSIQSNACTIRLGCADGSFFHSSKALDCTGPWAPSQNWSDQTTTGRRKKVMAFHLETGSQFTNLQIQYHTEDVYLIPDVTQSGRSILCLASDTWDVDFGDDVMCLSPSDIAQAKAVLQRIAPNLINHLRGGRVYCDAYGPENMPVICPHPKLPGLVCAGHGSGSGFYLAPGIAHLALEQLQQM